MLHFNDPGKFIIALCDKLKDFTKELIKSKGVELIPTHLTFFSGKDAINKSLIIVQEPNAAGKCLPMVYLLNK
ncbi:uncharacterized protein OCT59_026533 [Rhizophagus irregularis]|nr:hypothetical protein OCT59_026533 [Rhizophagus irregularis]